MSDSATEGQGFDSSALAEAYFYEAFANIDSQAMSRVWLCSDSAFCVHPSGRPLVGYKAVQGSWQAMFKGGRPVNLFYRVLKRQVSGDMAIHLVEEEISAADGHQRGLVLATNCYLRTDGRWWLLSHHGSPLVGPERAETGASSRIH